MVGVFFSRLGLFLLFMKRLVQRAFGDRFGLKENFTQGRLRVWLVLLGVEASQ